MADEQQTEEATSQEPQATSENQTEVVVEESKAEEVKTEPVKESAAASDEIMADKPVEEAPKPEEPKVEKKKVDDKSTEAKAKVDASKLSDKAKKVLEEVSEMTVLELAELVKVLEDKFSVSAAPVAVAAAGGVAVVGGAAAIEEKSEYNINLINAGASKINVIKVVREVTDLGLKEAKDLVEGAPKMVKEGVKKADAEEIRKKLEAAGAKVELQ